MTLALEVTRIAWPQDKRVRGEAAAFWVEVPEEMESFSAKSDAFNKTLYNLYLLLSGIIVESVIMS